MKLLIVAGGGGHFSPVLAVRDEIPKDWDVLVVGRKYALEGDSALSLEFQTAKKLKIPFVPLTSGRLQRKISKHTVQSLLKVPVGFFQAMGILNKFKPDVVVSFGGYITVPIAMAAFFLRIPVVVHEQTFHAGLANKIVGKIADKICISWKTSEKYFPPDKTILTGNPLRKEFLKQNESEYVKEKSLPVLYITGGSAGAHGINVLIEVCLKNLLEKYIVIHQTGDASEFGDYDRMSKLNMTFPIELQKRYKAFKFIDPEKVVTILSNADLIISRSGMSTVTELVYLGKPTLFIPLPHGQGNEQLTNAKFVKKLGLAEIADQNSLTPAELENLINNMIKNISHYKQASLEAKKTITVSAAKNILGVIEDVYKNKKRTS